MYKTILVPLDGSARAERILPHIEELAQQFHARVVLLQVVGQEEMAMKMPSEAQYSREMGVTTGRIADRPPAEAAQTYLSSKQARLQGQRIDTDIRVASGPVVQSIIDVAETENADLIAMASHGRSGLGHVFYGSVAAGVLHRIDRPLLIIRAKDDQPA